MHAAFLSSITDRELKERVFAAKQAERRITVELLHYLAEIARRRLYFEMGHTSLFTLLHAGMGYSKSGAYRRSVGAKLIALHPEIEHDRAKP